jgi:hypothetical protein
MLIILILCSDHFICFHMCPKLGTMGVFDSLHYLAASYKTIIDIIRK